MWGVHLRLELFCLQVGKYSKV